MLTHEFAYYSSLQSLFRKVKHCRQVTLPKFIIIIWICLQPRTSDKGRWILNCSHNENRRMAEKVSKGLPGRNKVKELS